MVITYLTLATELSMDTNDGTIGVNATNWDPVEPSECEWLVPGTDPEDPLYCE